MKYMLDTNICIYLIKKKPIQVLAKLQKMKASDICISAVTLCELEYGVQKSQHQAQNKLALSEFVASIEVMPFDADSAIRYGEIRAHLEKKGTPVGAYDMMIAAHALQLNLVLVSNDVREFQRIPRLKNENWV